MLTSSNLIHTENQVNPLSFTNISTLQDLNTNKPYVLLAGCVLEHILHSSSLTSKEKLFYLLADSLALISSKNNTQHRSTDLASINWARKLNCSKSKIFSMQKSLEEKRYFVIVREKNKFGKNQKNIIIPTLPDPVFIELCKAPTKWNSETTSYDPAKESKRAYLDRTKLFIKLNYQLLKLIAANEDLSSFAKVLFIDFYCSHYKSLMAATKDNNRQDGLGNDSSNSFIISYEQLMVRFNCDKATLSRTMVMLQNLGFLHKERFFVNNDDVEDNRHDKSLWRISLLLPASLQQELVKQKDRARIYGNYIPKEQQLVLAKDPLGTNYSYTKNPIITEIVNTDPYVVNSSQYYNKEYILNNKNKDNIDANSNFFKNSENLPSSSQVLSVSFKNSLEEELDKEKIEQNTQEQARDEIVSITPNQQSTIEEVSQINSSVVTKQSPTSASREDKGQKSLIPNKPPVQGKSLKSFYPLTKEQVDKLNIAAKREFSLNFANQLLLKLHHRYPDKRFMTKNHMMVYIRQAFLYELHQGPQVNHESFRFAVNDNKHTVQDREREQYLTGVEYSSDISYESQLRRKIAVTFEANLAYDLLTSCEFEVVDDLAELKDLANNTEIRSENLFKVKLPPRLNLTELQKAKLENAIKAVYGELEIIYAQKKERRVGWWHNKKVQANKQEPNNPVLKQIRKILRNSYGEEKGQNLYISWFAKIETEINEQTKYVILKAPTNFIKDWVKNNFRNIFEEACNNLSLYLDKFNPIIVKTQG